MECPKCGLTLDADLAECPRCGIVVAKFRHAHDASSDVAVNVPPFQSPTEALAKAKAEHDAARRELAVRALALPGALLVARILVKEYHGLIRLFTMWVHESGHALTAWLCGFSAMPGPWVTPVSPERSPMFTMALIAALAFGAYSAWRLQRAFWVVVSSGTLLLVLYCTLAVSHVRAQELITFGGDGGCFVLGTVLMLTMYARADHPIRENEIRWGLLVIGALAFMDAYSVWSGPIDRLPFGENEMGISDASKLSEWYGVNALVLIRWYLDLARACFGVLCVVYVTMVVRAVREARVAGRGVTEGVQ